MVNGRSKLYQPALEPKTAASILAPHLEVRDLASISQALESVIRAIFLDQDDTGRPQQFDDFEPPRRVSEIADIAVDQKENCFPMIPSGKAHNEMLLGEDVSAEEVENEIGAEGKVLVASQGGKKVPDGALIGPDGQPSSDPHLLYGEYTPTGPRNNSQGTGAIRAFGDHKGSGLAFMCEILGGALSGTGATDPKRGRFANGMLSFYVDPKVFDPAGFFPQDIARYVAFVKSSKPEAVDGEILVPGEPEARMRAKRRSSSASTPRSILRTCAAG